MAKAILRVIAFTFVCSATALHLSTEVAFTYAPKAKKPVRTVRADREDVKSIRARQTIYVEVNNAYGIARVAGHRYYSDDQQAERRAYVERAYKKGEARIAAKHRLTLQQLSRIMAEGRAKKWPQYKYP